jgi:hypothetical protein
MSRKKFDPDKILNRISKVATIAYIVAQTFAISFS